MMRAYEFLFEYANVDSPQFKAWFGNSKVVDATGKPLVCYHGTWKPFDHIDPSLCGDLGAHFTSDPKVASMFTGISFLDGSRDLRNNNVSSRVIPVYLKIENPVRMHDHGAWDAFDVIDELHSLKALTDDEADEMRKLCNQGMYSDSQLVPLLQEKGIDGVVYENTAEGGGDSWIIFNPDQARPVFSFRNPVNESHHPSDNCRDECFALEEYAQSIGVDLHITPHPEEQTLSLHGIYRETGQPGAGADIMNRLCDIGDKYGLEIRLDAQDGNPKLFDYYYRWGFDLEQDVVDDMAEYGDEFKGPWLMYRMPQGEPLTEGYSEPVLFHGTDFISLLQIVQMNQFGENDENKFDRNCFTRSKAVALHFAKRRSSNFFDAWEVSPDMTDEDIAWLEENNPIALAEYDATGGRGNGCVIVINRQRLAHNYKIIPYDEGQGNSRAHDEYYKEHLKRLYGDDWWKSVENERKYESEERVIRKIKDATRYIDAIFFRDPREWSRFEAAVHERFGTKYNGALGFIESKTVPRF